MIDKKEGSTDILRKNKLIRKSLALLLVLSMFLQSGVYRSVFADETTSNASVEFVYDLSEINDTTEVEERQGKRFTVTAKLKDVLEVTVAGLSFQYDKDKLEVSSEGKDVATYASDSYQSGIWKATTASKNDESNGVITYEAYVDTNCSIVDKSSDEHYTITSTNEKNRLFNSNENGYEFVTFTFTLKSGADIETALKSVKLNADDAESAYTGYYEDGIFLGDGKEANKEVDYTKGNSGIVKLTLNKVYDTSTSAWNGTKDFYIAKGSALKDIQLPEFGINKGQGIIGWSESNGGPDLQGTTVFASDKQLFTKLGNYITFDLNGGSAGEGVTITPQLVNTESTFEDLLKAAGFKNESGEYVAPTRSHYGLANWTYGNENNVISLDSNPTDQVYALKANWTPTNYTINYNLDGATNSESNLDTYNVECGTNNDGTLTLADATKAGHTFTGWYTAANGTGTEVTSITTTNIDELLDSENKVNLYPSFDINKYNVTEPTSVEGEYTISAFAITGATYEEGKVEYSTNANISFTIELDKSCTQSTPAVSVKIGEKEEQVAVTNNNNGTFSVECKDCEINGAVSFEISGVEKNKYAVTLPSVTGATLEAASDFDADSVEHGNGFQFTLKLDAAYNQNKPVVKFGDTTLEGTQNGNTYTYTIGSVTGNIENISVETLTKNQYYITLAGANDDIYFTTDGNYSTKKDAEDSKTTHDETYNFYVKYTNTSSKYKGYKVKVGSTYLSDNNNTGTDETIFTEDHAFTTEAITADTIIAIEPVYNCAIKVVFKQASESVAEESYSIQALKDDNILNKLSADTTYTTKLNEFLAKYDWLTSAGSYKLEDGTAVDTSSTVTADEGVTIVAQFTRNKYVIKYTGANFKTGTTGLSADNSYVTQEVSIASGDQDFALLKRTNIDPISKINEGKMFKGWKYEGKDAPTNTSTLNSIDLFKAGPEFTAEWVNLADFDEDNNITLTDLAGLLQAYGSDEDRIEDMDCSGKVNALDLAMLLKYFGNQYSNTTDAGTSTD